jgi:xanthine dehydrogenase YagS FAD-binding subunit
MRAFEYAAAASLAEARKLVVEGSVFKGSGIDLLDLMKERIAQPKRVVSLAGIPELAAIEERDGALRIGAGVTLTTLAEDERVQRRFPGLAEAAGEAATPQVRNRATVAGNLLQRPRCWYFRSADFHCAKKGGGECFAVPGRNRFHAIFGSHACPVVHASNLAPVLFVLDARAVIAGPGGERALPVSQLLLDPERPAGPEHALAHGEVVVAVEIPKEADGLATAYAEAREKESFDWALVSAAVGLALTDGKITEARIVLGAVAPIPWRAPDAERALAGKTPGGEAFTAAAEAAFAGARPLSENAFKVPVGKAVVRDALRAAAARNAGR